MSAARLRAIALGAILAATLVGCTSDDPPPPQTTNSTTAPAPTPPPSAGTTPPPVSDGEEPMESDFGESNGAPAPVWDETSRAEAQTLAQEVMTAYARPSLPQEQWWAEFSAHLSAQAAYDYQWVEPGSIPATAVTGPATITAEPSVYLAELAVPTDAGPYGILLSRTDGPSPWQVERITPPEPVEAPADGEPA
jgi:hypothetical protein